MAKANVLNTGVSRSGIFIDENEKNLSETRNVAQMLILMQMFKLVLDYNSKLSTLG